MNFIVGASLKAHANITYRDICYFKMKKKIFVLFQQIQPYTI